MSWPVPTGRDCMGTLWYVASCSLDGYRADAEGRFGWSAPSEEVHTFINDVLRNVGTYVMGRRMYETMKVWDSMPAGQSRATDEYASIWDATDKVVCSDTLPDVEMRRATLEPRLTVERLEKLVGSTDGVVSVDGPTTAAPALRAGLVDELHLFVVPQVVGGGLRALPDGARLTFTLADERRFENGTVYLRYRRP